MQISATVVDLDGPTQHTFRLTLRTGDEVRLLERGADYDYDPKSGSFVIKNLVLSGVLTITSIHSQTSVSVGKTFRLVSAQKSNQPNYRDILPKRARRW